MHVRIENFRTLSKVDLQLPRFGLLTGANGSGKSTFIALLRFARLALERNLDEAWSMAFRGSRNAISKGSTETMAVLAIAPQAPEGPRWAAGFTETPTGISVTDGIVESTGSPYELKDKKLWYRGTQIHWDYRRSILRAILESEHADVLAKDLAEALGASIAFAVPDLETLRMRGSRISDPAELTYRSDNLFSVLYRWHGRRPDKPRYNFVLDGLKAAFPRICNDLDFETLNDNVQLRVYAPSSEKPTWASEEAEGFLMMMALLTQIASAPDGGLVAIDEPETSLHPFALREFMRRARAWSTAHNVTVLLATHSPVLLNEFNSEPQSVIVFGEDANGPVPLTQLKNPEWLANFTLGELLENLSIGSNAQHP